MSVIKKHTDGEELDLLALVRFLLGKCWVIIGLGVICGISLIVMVKAFSADRYTAAIRLYVNNMTNTKEMTNITYSDLTTSIMLTDTYITIIDSDAVFDDVIKKAKVSYTKKELEQMTSITSVNNTEVLRIAVTSSDPKEAARIANAFSTVVVEKLADIVEGSSVKILDKANVPDEPDSKKLKRNGILGFLAGAILGMFVLLIVAFRETNIRNEKELEAMGLPFLGIIPDAKKVKDRRGKGAKTGGRDTTLLKEDSSFAVREAYNTLRTNLVFSITGKKCKKVLLTSCVAHEGKTTNAINLCQSLAESGFRTILLDCDLRMSTISNRLNITEKPGLSDFLVGMAAPSQVVQKYRERFDIITSGTIPPNPSELLASSEFATIIRKLEGMYDYIIMDAPPVMPVSDAVILSKNCDGYIMIVRNNTVKRDLVKKSMKDMSVSKVKFLGFVYTCATVVKGKYSGYKYGYYEGYSKKIEKKK